MLEQLELVLARLPSIKSAKVVVNYVYYDYYCESHLLLEVKLFVASLLVDAIVLSNVDSVELEILRIL